MENPEVIIVLIGVLGSAVTGILAYFNNRSSKRIDAAQAQADDLNDRLEAAEQRASTFETTLNHRIETTTAMYQSLLENMRAEIDRHTAAAAAAGKIHKSQLAAMESVIGQLSEATSRLSAEKEELRQQLEGLRADSARWAIEREELLEALAVETRRHRETKQEAKNEVAQLRERIRLLEASRNDGNLASEKVAE